MGTAGQFGADVVAADFDGDGQTDLAVGTPPDRVYVYFGPLIGQPQPSITITGEPSSDFGRRLSAIGRSIPGKDLLVSSPGATVSGSIGAGKIYRFQLDKTMGTVSYANALAAVYDDRREEGEGFGASVGELRFNSLPCGVDQPLIYGASRTNILTFFRYPQSASDPRCFMQN